MPSSAATQSSRSHSPIRLSTIKELLGCTTTAHLQLRRHAQRCAGVTEEGTERGASSLSVLEGCGHDGAVKGGAGQRRTGGAVHSQSL